MRLDRDSKAWVEGEKKKLSTSARLIPWILPSQPWTLPHADKNHCNHINGLWWLSRGLYRAYYKTQIILRIVPAVESMQTSSANGTTLSIKSIREGKGLTSGHAAQASDRCRQG